MKQRAWKVNVVAVTALGILVPLDLNATGLDVSTWNQILKTHVKPTRIDGIALSGFDYRRLSRSREKFDRLVEQVSSFDLSRLTSKNQKLAFWINVYNILAVKMALDRPGIQSLMDIGPKRGAVWKKRALEIRGQSFSLDAVEHKILRKLNEPRMHFAIVCASVSCPDLRQEAYDDASLDAQLNDQVRRFLANTEKGLRFYPTERKMKLSKLFEWFAADFGSTTQLRNFIAEHMPKKQKPPAGWRDFQMTTFEYNWKLNRLSNSSVQP